MSIFLFSIPALSTPREIVIIRHADKWNQKNYGPYLSPKGQVRAEKFVSYYLSHFHKPDFIFASKPGDAKHPNESDSLRPFQTVMPLANELTFLSKQNFIIQTPYFQKQYLALANDLLHQKKYQDKQILIAWHHGKINFLTRDLGVTKKLAKWKGDNFDMVYVLKYDVDGKLTSFQILKNQYSVKNNVSWQALAHQSQ